MVAVCKDRHPARPQVVAVRKDRHPAFCFQNLGPPQGASVISCSLDFLKLDMVAVRKDRHPALPKNGGSPQGAAIITLDPIRLSDQLIWACRKIKIAAVRKWWPSARTVTLPIRMVAVCKDRKLVAVCKNPANRSRFTAPNQRKCRLPESLPSRFHQDILNSTKTAQSR
jgi:hypothetical protein